MCNRWMLRIFSKLILLTIRTAENPETSNVQTDNQPCITERQFLDRRLVWDRYELIVLLDCELGILIEVSRQTVPR